MQGVRFGEVRTGHRGEREFFALVLSGGKTVIGRRVRRGSVAALVIAAAALVVSGGMVMPGLSTVDSSAPRTLDLSAYEWHALPSMSVPRSSPAVVVLESGDVLVAGGMTASGPTATTEIFDTDLATWRPGPNMASKRAGATATLLSGGRVLIVGGETGQGVTSSAEVVDMTAAISTAVPDMALDRTGHAAVLLGNGKVLVTGGTDWLTGPWKHAELFDPEVLQWSSGGIMVHTRVFLSLHLLGDGDAIAVGGDSTGSSERYDPDTNTWSSEALMQSVRYHAGAVKLADGRLLVAGGLLLNLPLRTAEVYDPATNAWTRTTDMADARAKFSLAPVGTSAVLAAGSSSGLGTTSTCELFYPGNSTWWPAKPMAASRGEHGFAAIAGDSVLVMGGRSGGAIVSSAELFSEEVPEPEPEEPCEPIDLVPLVLEATELPGQSARGLIAKLVAAQDQYENGSRSVCVNIMNAFYHQVRAFAQSDHLSRTHAVDLYEGYAAVLECMGETPLPPSPEMLPEADLGVGLILGIATFFGRVLG